MKRILLLSIFGFFFLYAASLQPGKGYRGFADWSNSLSRRTVPSLTNDNSLTEVRKNLFYTGFSTVHGYQFNPNIFLGAGFGMEFADNDFSIVPLFLDLRTDLKLGIFTPFADIRVGFNMSEGDGVYISPSLGYRFNWGRKAGINFALGYTLQGYKVDRYDIDSSVRNGVGYWHVVYLNSESHAHSYFSFRVGLDF